MISHVAIVTKAIAVLVYLVLVSLVLRSNLQAKLKIFFFLYLLGLLIWQFSSLMIHFTGTPNSAIFWYKILGIGITIQSILFFPFSRVFLNIKNQKILAYLSYLSALFVMALPFLANIYSGVVKGEGGYYIPLFTKTLYIGGSIGYIFWGLGIYNFVKSYIKETSKLQRNRIKYILAGALVVIVGSLSNFTKLQSYPIDIVCNIVNSLLLYYAVQKHHLLELRIVFKKGLIIFSIVLSFILFFIGMNYMLNRMFHIPIGNSITMSGIISVSLMLVFILILRYEGINRIFQTLIVGDSKKYQEALKDFSKEASSFIQIEDLENYYFDIVSKVIKPVLMALYIYNRLSGKYELKIQYSSKHGYSLPERLDENIPVLKLLKKNRSPVLKDELSVVPEYKLLPESIKDFFIKNNTEVIVPVIMGEELYGFLIIGEKKDRRVYSSADLTFLSTLSYNAAITCSNIKSYQEIRDRLSEQMLLFVISENFRASGKVEKLIDKTAELLIDFLRVKWAAISLNSETGIKWSSMFTIKGNYTSSDKEFVEKLSGKKDLFKYLKPLVNTNYTYVVLSDSFLMNNQTYPEESMDKNIDEKKYIFLPLVQDGESFGFLLLRFEDAGRVDYMVKKKANLLRSLQAIISQGIMLHYTITELKSAKDRTENILEGIGRAGNIIFIVNGDGKITTMNSASYRLLDYTFDDLINRNITEIVSGKEKLLFDRIFCRDCSKNVIDSLETSLIKRDGTLLPVLVSLFAIRDKASDSDLENFFLFIARDISALKRAKESIKKSEERYRKLFNEIDEVIITWNSDEKITDINYTGVKVLNYSSAKGIIGRRVGEIFGMNENMVKEIEADVKNLGEVKNREIRVNLNGKDLIFLANFSSVYSEDRDEIIEYKGVFHDITELKKLERQLIQAQKLESIGTLAGGIAHDFNNIMTAILGYASVMKMKFKRDDPFYQYLEVIESSAERAASLTRKLLTFSRSEKYQLKLVDVNKVIKETVALLKETIERKIEVRLDLYPKSLTIRGDESQIHQVVMNLCVNARDAMSGGGVLNISTWIKEFDRSGICKVDKPAKLDSKDSKKYFAVISVEDTGCGMDDSVMKRMFDPFFTTKNRGEGTGLGLSVVYGIVRNHNGLIDVQSSVGVGTRFDVMFPLVDSDVGEEEKESRTLIEGFGETILVVDDEEYVRNLLADILESNGYKVILAKDGIEALERFKKSYNNISAAIIDMVMPRMDGLETYRELLKINPDLKVIVATGYSSEERIKEIMSRGIKDFIVKPFNVEDLLLSLRKIIDE